MIRRTHDAATLLATVGATGSWAMSVLTISNNESLNRWLGERMRMERDVYAIKGPPPAGATYMDGTPIVRPVNIAWRDGTTGEVFAIEYEATQ